jgi:hypothetical protein
VFDYHPRLEPGLAKDATRWRLKWYAGMSVMAMLGVARVKGILP